MSILTMEYYDKLVNGDSIKGVALVSDYSKRLTEQQKPFIDGNLMVGDSIPFKIWQGVTCDNFIKFDYSNVVCHITGVVQVYRGMKSVIIDVATPVDGYDAFDFYSTRYAIDTYVASLIELAKGQLSEGGFSLLSRMLFDNKDIMGRFKLEFAAKSHHDNCKGGLLGHTYKLLYHLIGVMNLYPKLTPTQASKDLFVIGGILHDLGKIFEMYLGVYQPNSAVSHRILGLEYLSRFKNDIVSIYDTKWYYDLVSIIVQHHHTYGDPARTVPAYLIHIIDNFEATMTSLEECVSKGGDITIAGEMVRVNNETRLFL